MLSDKQKGFDVVFQHSDIMDDFIACQKDVRASMQASLDQLLAGNKIWQGQVGIPGLEDISDRQIGMLKSAIGESGLLIADYEADNA